MNLVHFLLEPNIIKVVKCNIAGLVLETMAMLALEGKICTVINLLRATGNIYAGVLGSALHSVRLLDCREKLPNPVVIWET